MAAETTTARVSLKFGMDHYRNMSDDQLRRIYRAAWIAHAEAFGESETREVVEFAAPSSTSLAAARGRKSIAYTCCFVSQVISELCERDTVVIPASPETREWSQTEGGHRIFHASPETIKIVEAFMAA